MNDAICCAQTKTVLLLLLLLRDEFNSFKCPGMSVSHPWPAIQGELLKALVRKGLSVTKLVFYLALDVIGLVSA